MGNNFEGNGLGINKVVSRHFLVVNYTKSQSGYAVFCDEVRAGKFL
jgi:hypothetical protein